MCLCVCEDVAGRKRRACLDLHVYIYIYHICLYIHMYVCDDDEADEVDEFDDFCC